MNGKTKIELLPREDWRVLKRIVLEYEWTDLNQCRPQIVYIRPYMKDGEVEPLTNELDKLIIDSIEKIEGFKIKNIQTHSCYFNDKSFEKGIVGGKRIKLVKIGLMLNDEGINEKISHGERAIPIYQFDLKLYHYPNKDFDIIFEPGLYGEFRYGIQDEETIKKVVERINKEVSSPVA